MKTGKMLFHSARFGQAMLVALFNHVSRSLIIAPLTPRQDDAKPAGARCDKSRLLGEDRKYQ